MTERVRRDLSLRHFLREAFHALTDVDSALIGTFRALLTRPGMLTTEYIYGDRHRFLAPFRVFLICNVIYFLAVSHFHANLLTAPLESQVGGMPYARVTMRALQHHYSLRGPAPNETLDAQVRRIPPDISKRYDGVTEELAKTIVVVLVPLYAIVLSVLFIGSHRYFAEHFVFATHYVSVYLLALPAVTLALVGYWAIIEVGFHQHVAQDEDLLALAFMVFVGVYVYRAQREFYESRPWPALARTLVIALSAVPVLLAFKFLLFFTTLAWIS